jgi:hypothetical protein
MESSLLQYLLSFDNKFNEIQGSSIPLYEFHRLYEDRTTLSDDERQSLWVVKNEQETGFHVLNPFLISLLIEHSIWFAPSSQFNAPWDAGGGLC